MGYAITPAKLGDFFDFFLIWTGRYLCDSEKLEKFGE